VIQSWGYAQEVNVSDIRESKGTATQPDGNNGAATPAPSGVEDFAVQLEGFLSKLIPPDSVSVHTVDGKEITIPGAIPARRQVVVFRIMRDLTEMPLVAQALGGLSASKDDMTGIVDVILALSTDIEVAERLGDIFDAAYPDALDGVPAVDALPLEDLVTAILPFSERFIKRVGAGMMSLAQVAEDMPAS
jgi:hypothetical protein